MARIRLEPDQVALLRDVQAGRVARHRLRRGDSPADGDDYQQDPGRGPGGLRKARARLKVLKSHGLVALPAGDATAESWPWITTDLGDTALARAAEQQQQAIADRENEETS
jgi:hypothetical protein